MLVTLVALLIVNIVNKKSFESDIKAVDEILVIMYYAANMRLMFQSMFYWSNKATPLSERETYEWYRN